MRKLTPVLLVALCVFFAGCPKTGLSLDQAPPVIEGALGAIGINADAYVQDVDGDGRLDFHVVCHGEDANLSETRYGWLVGGVTGALREAARDAYWSVDTAYLEINQDLYRAYMSDLYACEGMTDLEQGFCILGAWTKISDNRYGRTEPAPNTGVHSAD